MMSCDSCGAPDDQSCRPGCKYTRLERFAIKLPDPSIEVTPQGGKHTRLDVRTDLLPPKALLELAEVLKIGADKYGVDNWRQIDQTGHLNHALTHLLKYLHTKGREDLRNAACRLLFALETE